MAIVAVILCLIPCSRLSAQTTAALPPKKVNPNDMQRLHDMLQFAYLNLKKHYYDPNFHGVDIEARYHEFETRLANVPTMNDGMRLVAAYLDGMKDSHTHFIPPMRPYQHDLGFRFQLIGDKCYITRVRPKTDAVGKLTPGDEVTKFNNYIVNRTDIGTVEYYFTALNPAPGIDLQLLSPDGVARQEAVKAFFKQGQRQLEMVDPNQHDLYDLELKAEEEDHLLRSRFVESGDVMFWKLNRFDLTLDQIGDAFSKAKKHGTLVLDLRGNPGGYTEVLKQMVGNLFTHDVKIQDRVTRKETKPLIAKSVGSHAYAGKLIVLVDSNSASASEIFARVMQLEHRGTVIGDRTEGAVMESLRYSESSGADTQVMFAYSITDANVIMSDGVSLERVGVTPDDISLPTAQDMAAGRDPVLAHAAEVAGVKITPEAAGKMFPFVWLPL